MKKKILSMCVALMVAGTIQTHAQGIGGLWRKAKKAVDKVTGIAGTATQASPGSGSLAGKGTDVAIPGGGTIRNPIPNIIDVQLIGAYGKSTSANYGTVSLVFKVKMIANKNSISFGVNSELPGLMIDQDGNTYQPQETAGWYPYSVAEGVYMNVSLKGHTDFVDVKRTATTIQQLQVGISASYDDKGLIVLKDVPIQWDADN